jgi:hypothetical protein
MAGPETDQPFFMGSNCSEDLWDFSVGQVGESTKSPQPKAPGPSRVGFARMPWGPHGVWKQRDLSVKPT